MARPVGARGEERAIEMRDGEIGRVFVGDARLILRQAALGDAERRAVAVLRDVRFGDTRDGLRLAVRRAGRNRRRQRGGRVAGIAARAMP